MLTRIIHGVALYAGIYGIYKYIPGKYHHVDVKWEGLNKVYMQCLILVIGTDLFE